VHPLTVAVNSKSKERLILDLRYVNKQVVQNKIKFEDWSTAKQYMQINSFSFIFDLTSGYHHIYIFPLHQTYLGFTWNFNNIDKYFVFTVLSFGRQSSAYIFSKVLRPLVARWHRNSIQVVLNNNRFNRLIGIKRIIFQQLSVRHLDKIKLLFHSEIIVGLLDVVTSQSSIKKNPDARSFFPLHQTYLGFAWNFNNIDKYFVFTVLSFGRQSSSYIFLNFFFTQK
jgi:hypothetical protein